MLFDIFDAVRRCNVAKKSKLLKAHLGSHTKFQLPSSISRGVMRGINSKSKKTRPKTYIFKTASECNGSEKSESPKVTSVATTKRTYQISTT